eukprot:g5759.t1
MAEESQRLLQSGADVSGTVSTRGMRIVFKDLDYTVPSNKERGKMAYLLRGVNAYFSPGQMAALIGPSGSGKTTLMDILAGRKTQGTITGKLLFSNQAPTKAFLRRYTGYVEQFDTLLESLTVKEMLIYTAELKKPIDEPFDKKLESVDTLIKKLSLEGSRDKKIGRQGGLKKRVNIGIALITNPRVLFLDEPTTGLDSNTANDIMTVVKHLVSDGTTICSTIHSPTPYCFGLFDRVLFLLRGEVVFFGERAQAGPFVESLTEEGSRMYDNQAEWLTAVMVRAEREDQGPVFAEKFRQSKLKADSDALIESFISTEEETDEIMKQELEVTQATVTPNWFAFKTLLKYRSRKNFLDPGFLIPRVSDKVVFCILVCLTYQGIADDMSGTNMVNIAAAVFAIAVLPSFGAGIYTPTLVLERALFYRELDDGLYRPAIYLLARMFDEVIMALICTFIFGSIMWKIVAFQGKIVYLWAVYFGHLFNGIAAAYIFAAVAPDVNVANALLQTFTVILMFFCGFLILPDDIPAYWIWLYRLDYVSYGYAALMVNQFEEFDDKIEREQLQISPVLEYYDMDDVDKDLYTAIVYFFSIAFLVIAFLSMTYIRHQKR